MIFSPPLYGRVLASRKTQTRRLVKASDYDEFGIPRKYKVGMRRAVQPGRGKPAEAYIVITALRTDFVGAITFEDARAEGFRTTDEFKAYWLGLHDAPWIAHQDPDDAINPVVVRDRFESAHAHKRVWVLTFELDSEERLRLLAERNARADYVESPALALSGSADPGEAVDVATQERYSREGIQGWVAREGQRELDRELLMSEDRMRLVRIEARAQGVDISQIEMVIRQRIREAERKVNRRKAA